MFQFFHFSTKSPNFVFLCLLTMLFIGNFPNKPNMIDAFGKSLIKLDTYCNKIEQKVHYGRGSITRLCEISCMTTSLVVDFLRMPSSSTQAVPSMGIMGLTSLPTVAACESLCTKSIASASASWLHSNGRTNHSNEIWILLIILVIPI
jgi:hypothetical protein